MARCTQTNAILDVQYFRNQEGVSTAQNFIHPSGSFYSSRWLFLLYRLAIGCTIKSNTWMNKNKHLDEYNFGKSKHLIIKKEKI